MPSPSPPPPATAAATSRRRRRLLPSSTTAYTSSSSSSFASFSFAPSPSPFHHRLLPSPLHGSSVPFSWEHRPGIPKTPARSRSSKPHRPAPLPLPPSLLSNAGAYVAAMPQERKRRGKLRRTPAIAAFVAEWLSVLSLYRSCKRAAGCFVAPAKAL